MARCLRLWKTLVAYLGTIRNIHKSLPIIATKIKKDKLPEGEREKWVEKIVEGLMTPVDTEYLHKLLNQVKQKEESYSKKLIDFVKWTSTIAVAAILWIGNDITSVTGWPQFLSILGLIILIFSLFFAVYSASIVLSASGSYWKLAGVEYYHRLMVHYVGENPSQFEQGELKRSFDDCLKTFRDVIDYSKPEKYVSWVKCHIYFLAAGLSSYVLSQISLSISCYG